MCFLLFLSCLSTVSAKDFTQTTTSKDVQDFIDNTTTQDNIVNLQTGNYSLKELNINRNLTIRASNDSAIVNIKGDGTSTLFNVKSQGVIIQNLNIIDFGVAINSSSDKLTVKNNKITHTHIMNNTTGVIITNSDNVIENNLINTTKDSIVLNIGSFSNNISTNIIKNNTIISWQTYAIYSNTTGNIENLYIEDNYLKSTGYTVIFITCENITNFDFKNNIVRSESEDSSKTIIDIKFQYNVENMEIINNDIHSNWTVTGITITTSNLSIISNMKNINIKDNIIYAASGSIVLSPTGTIENINLTNNTLTKTHSDRNYLVTIHGEYISNFNIIGNDLKGSTIFFTVAKGNFTVENNKFLEEYGVLRYGIEGTIDNDIITNILINNNTGTFPSDSFYCGFLNITINGDLNNLIITNNNITGVFGRISANNGLINRIFVINNTGESLLLNIYSNATDIQISNNILKFLEYIGGTLDNAEVYITNNTLLDGFYSGSRFYEGIRFSVSEMNNSKLFIINNSLNGNINVSGITIDNSEISIKDNIFPDSYQISVSGSPIDNSKVNITNNVFNDPHQTSTISVSGNSSSSDVFTEPPLRITDPNILHTPPNVNLTGDVDYNNYTIIVNDTGFESIIYIDGVTLDSLNITVHANCKAQITIINSNITSLTITVNSDSETDIIVNNSNFASFTLNDNSNQSHITITNNNISRLNLNFNSNTPNAYIVENNINLNGTIFAFGGIVNCINLTFKNNTITGDRGIVITSAFGTAATVNNLNISTNNINVSEAGIIIDNRLNIYPNENGGALTLNNFIIENNIINSGNGIQLRPTFSSNVMSITITNLLIINNFINASVNGIYYQGSTITNQTIENNIIYANGEGIYYSFASTITGFVDILSNDIKVVNGNGIIFTTNAYSAVTINNITIKYNDIKTTHGNGIEFTFSQMALIFGVTINNLIINYNSIVAGGTRLLALSIVPTVIDIDYNWWGHSNISTIETKFSSASIFAKLDKYYNVSLDNSSASGVGDFVYTRITLNDGTDLHLNELPDFYVTINNNGKIENVLAKDGRIEILPTPGIYTIGYNSDESDSKVTFNIASKGNTSINYITNIDRATDKLTVYAILQNANGVGLAGKLLFFEIDGKFFNRTTDNNGLAIVEFDISEYHDISLKITFNEDNDYLETSISTIISVDSFLTDNERIQQLIDFTPEGGILNLTGNYTDLHLIISKSITIYGGKIVSSLNSPIFSITGSNVTLIGFELSIPNGVAIDIKDGASNVKILNNHIRDSQVGVIVNNALHVDILNNEFIRCRDGIDLRGKGDIDYITIQDNFISGRGTSGPSTVGDRYGGDGNGIIIDANIPNLLITRNTITNNAHGIILDDGLGNGPVNLFNSVYSNILTGNNHGLEATGTARSIPDPLTLGANWYGGLSDSFTCARLSNSIPILVELISVDDQGNVLVYFYYIDPTTGAIVYVTDLPDIPVEFSLNGYGRDLVYPQNGIAAFDYTTRVFSNAGIGVTIYAYVGAFGILPRPPLNVTLTSEEIMAGIGRSMQRGERNPDGSWVTPDNNQTGGTDTGNNSSSGNGTGTGTGNGTGIGAGTGSGSGLGNGTGNGSGIGSGFGYGLGSGTGFGMGTGSDSGTGLGINTGTTSNPGTNPNTDKGQGYQGPQVAQAGITNVAAANVAATNSGGSDIGGESGEASESSGDNPDAYEITPKDPTQNTDNNSLLITAIVIFSILLLLGIGIKRGALSSLFKKQ